ncbi:MAG: glutamate racemase [Chitinophagales bacterium]
MNKETIGIFDSGIGGLTVANAISRLLPNEALIYFGDTAHLPYGDKSESLIKTFSLNIANFLIEKQNCKAIVIACNTASAVAYEHLRDKHKGNIPIINVIDPIIEAIVKDETIKKVGLIATQTTINSGVYQEKIKRRKPEVDISVLATPLLVPMIEEGFAHDNISHAVIENYLQNPKFKNIDALILGCTHYILIKDEINDYFKAKVKLFDSTDILAEKLKGILENENLLSTTKEQEDKFYASDITKDFQKSARRFYGNSLELKPITI